MPSKCDSVWAETGSSRRAEKILHYELRVPRTNHSYEPARGETAAPEGQKVRLGKAQEGMMMKMIGCLEFQAD